MSASIRSQRVRRVPSGRTNRSSGHSARTESRRALRGLASPISTGRRVRQEGSPRSSLRTPTRFAQEDGDPVLTSPIASRKRPGTAPASFRGGLDGPRSPGSATSRKPSTRPRSSNSRHSGAQSGRSPGTSTEPPAKQPKVRTRKSSVEQIQEMVSQAENSADLPEMFHLNKRKQRLLQQHQYEVLWKRAQEKLTTVMYARYPTLVSMFRAFDEDKDGTLCSCSIVRPTHLTWHTQGPLHTRSSKGASRKCGTRRTTSAGKPGCCSTQVLAML